MAPAGSTVDRVPEQLIACPECDLLIDVDVDAPLGASVRCPRCDAELFRVRAKSFERTLALTISALILLLLANVFPVVGLNIQGHRIDATLIGAAIRLWDADMPLLAGLVASTTIAIPAFELGAVLWMAWSLWRGRRPAGFVTIIRMMHFTHPWGMVEVFMLGILVSLVKLAHLAEVLPGVGIVAYGGVMLLVTAIGASYDQRKLWQTWEGARP
jgi:paraquat-inducible protein A